MSQALHTASTGINAGQSQINVIANNVANINTTAYKAANMTFETLYSNNLSSGSAATKDGGGTNPKQIGLGVKIGGITRDFTSGTFVSTGRDMDCKISGTGFFVVQDADGSQYYTRDGVFNVDSEGNLVTQSGMKVVAATTSYSNAGSDKTVSIPTTIRAVVEGDTNIGSKKLSELNGASITTGNISTTMSATAADGSATTLDVTLNIDNADMTIDEVCAAFNSQIAAAAKAANVTAGTSFSASNGAISTTGSITYNEDGTTSNFVGQTGLSSGSSSKVLNYTADIQDVINYNDSYSHSISSTTIDENGTMIATYDDGSILTQYLDGTYTMQWKYMTPEGVTIAGSDVSATGSTISNSNFTMELATMVNQEGLISLNDNLWKWGPDVGDIYYGMAGEMSFGAIETGGYEGSNVDIATELSNMITAQRMIQMNSRVFSTASSVMETLAYLGQ
jgi:flagellar hook protein FlgE